MILGPKYRKKFSTINAGIVAEIVERYLNNPEDVSSDELEVLASVFDINLSFPKNTASQPETFFKDSGYLYADINPLKAPNKYADNLAPDESDMPYLKKIGYEFSHLRNIGEKKWFTTEIAKSFPSLSNEKKLVLLESLLKAEGFEQYLHKSFVGARWYSLEGSEALIIIIDEIIEQCKEYDSINFGMPHRGRLNILAHIFGKPYREIFSEFREEGINNVGSSKNDDYLKDVKYHLGAKKTKDSELFLFPNPSHLEMINPVILGVTKAQQMNGNSSLGVMIHGDAAFPGEGINSETFNLSKLKDYNTNGSVHIVTNNQVGFTTNPEDSYPSLFSTDFVRGFDIPIIHVNADDIESCINATRLALKYKNKFNKDIVIDLIAYRRYGHQEMDDPSITQPKLYEQINKHPTITNIFSNDLISENIISIENVNILKANNFKKFESENTQDSEIVSSIWPGEFKIDQIDYEKSSEKISLKDLSSLNNKLYAIDKDFSVNSRVDQVFKRRKNFELNSKIEWGHAELLSIASLANKGTSIRFSGQDSQRGTFNQRNAVIWDTNGNGSLNLLDNINNNRYSHIINSPLSEMATIAFEFGFSIVEDKSLVIWEAQFGDFVNNAQSVIDEFVTSSQPKWGLDSNLVLLLPHGYEGMGPNHSSGWMERFLESADNNNIAVANCTTSSQYFHLLRAHCLLEKQANPLIVFTPKSLLRHPTASSTVEEICKDGFKVLLEKNNPKKPTKLVLGSGKIISDIISDEQFDHKSSPLIVSIEMLYPFPKSLLRALIKKNTSLKEIIWVQEEPQNRGPWNFIKDRIRSICPEEIRLQYVGRELSAATATGSASVHKLEQQKIIDSILK